MKLLIRLIQVVKTLPGQLYFVRYLSMCPALDSRFMLPFPPLPFHSLSTLQHDSQKHVLTPEAGLYIV